MTAVAFTGTPRVNLMPRSEIARRERDALVRLWLWIVFASVIVAVLIIAAAVWIKFSADQRLAEEQARTNVLLTEIASLSEVSQALNTEADLTAFRGEAMATDLAWTPVVSTLTSVLPSQADLTGYDLIAGGVPLGGDPALEAGLLGSVGVQSPTPLDIVAIIRSLRGVEGVLYADGLSVTPSPITDGSYAYVINMIFDQSVYSGAFADSAEEGSN